MKGLCRVRLFSPEIKNKTNSARKMESLTNTLIFGQMLSSSEKTECEDFQISGALGKEMEGKTNGSTTIWHTSLPTHPGGQGTN